MTSERQHVAKELAQYGKVMYELFKHLIALHRYHASVEGHYDKLTKQEQMARATILRTVAGMQRYLPMEDRNKLKAFSKALYQANLADGEDAIIDDVLHRLGAGRITT